MSMIIVTISLKSEFAPNFEDTHENAQALKQTFEGQDYALIEKTFGRGQFMNVSLPKERLAEFSAAVSGQCVLSEKREVDFPREGCGATSWEAFLNFKGLSHDR